MGLRIENGRAPCGCADPSTGSCRPCAPDRSASPSRCGRCPRAQQQQRARARLAAGARGSAPRSGRRGSPRRTRWRRGRARSQPRRVWTNGVCSSSLKLSSATCSGASEEHGEGAGELEALAARSPGRPTARASRLGQPEVAVALDELEGPRVTLLQLRLAGAAAVALGVEVPAMVRALQPPVLAHLARARAARSGGDSDRDSAAAVPGRSRKRA